MQFRRLIRRKRLLKCKAFFHFVLSFCLSKTYILTISMNWLFSSNREVFNDHLGFSFVEKRVDVSSVEAVLIAIEMMQLNKMNCFLL